jgi:alpha-glucosidase
MDWWREAVFYEIYVRSFQDSTDDGVGDLPGIIHRLDYLNDGTPRSLGVDALWLTPINPSPLFDFGYDISDYCDVDLLLGTLGDLDLLLAEAHRRGIRVILDLVPNHSSHLHPWFQASRQSRTDPHRDWYSWRNPAPDGGYPNNWASSFGGPAWTFDARTEQYYLHSFLPEQPDLDHHHPGVQQAIENVIRFWLERGVDGFRVDVVHKLLKHPDLPDNQPAPPEAADAARHCGDQQQVYDEDRPEVHDLLRRWRRLLRAYGDRMMVGEVYLFDPARVAAYYGSGDDELPLAFNLAFMWSPWDAAAFRREVDRIEALLPRGAQPTYVLSSHDAPRHRSRFDDPVWGAARARLAALMLLTLRGTPFLYYGEEIGMRDGLIPSGRVRDPLGKRCPAVNRDPARTPMQWTGEPGAGFTTAADAWLPISEDAAHCNVAAQDADADSLLNFYRRALWYRRGSVALRRGSYRALNGPADSFLYVREDADERRVVALNFSAERRTCALAESGEGVVELSTRPGTTPRRVRLDRCELGPVEGIVVRC